MDLNADVAPTPGSMRLRGWQENGARWIMLRPRGPQTLKVARLLGVVGVNFYCPTKTVMVRAPRASAHTPRKPRVYPIWSGLIFVDEDDLMDVLRVRETVVAGELVPMFGFWQDETGLMRVWDCEIDGLRAEEKKDKERQRVREDSLRGEAWRNDGLEVGMRVAILEGPLKGLIGVIKELHAVMAKIELPGAIGRVTIPRFRLAKKQDSD